MRCSLNSGKAVKGIYSEPKFNKLWLLTFLIITLMLINFSSFAKELIINGISGKPKANINKHLQELKQIKSLNQYSAEDLEEQISKAIQPFGYFKAKVHVIKTKPMSISVIPGPQIPISSLHTKIVGEGANNPLLKSTLNESPLKIGGPFLTQQYNQTKQSLLITAEKLGYMRASFKKNEILIDEKKYQVEIILIFDTGPLYYFGQVQFDPTYISPRLLHRFTPFKPGEVYSGDKLLQLNNDLSNSGYFSSVLVKPHITDNNSTIPVQIHLEPVPKYSYTLGAGYGTDTGIRGRAALHVIPVNRQGDKFNLVAQGSFVQNALQAQYLIPGRNPVTDQYSFTGNYSNLNYSAGNSNAGLLSFAHQRQLKNNRRTLSLNGLYEDFHYTQEEDTKQFLLYPRGIFTWSKTKDLLFSPSGYKVTLNGLVANRAVLSTINFAQLSLDAKAAYKFNPLGLRLYGHLIQGVSAINDINKQPLSLALLLGGADNLKAYSYNSIGPGRITSYGGFEIQKETKKNWYFVAFYDAGDVYNPDPARLRQDAGAGLMWTSPIGPIKVGVAQPFNSSWRTEGRGPRLVVSMGPDL